MASSVFSRALILLSISAVCFGRSVNIEKVSIEDDSPIASRKQAKFSGHLPYPLKLGAFNIKTFGKSKMSDDEVADYITQIVLRYDVILVQEIRDSSQESVIQLWRMVNSTRPYGLSISARLGRTSYKEQYAYFYRLDRVELIDTSQYDDSKDDRFEREPYSVRFRPIGQTVTWDFALIGIHAKPDHAVEEIGALLDVYNDVRQTWRDVEDVVLMGDFNADCSYADKDDLQHLPIYNQGIFQWLIDFNVDTTTSTNTDCAYDRLVVSGDHIRNAVIPGSVDIYKYEDYLGLDNDRTRDVSDHYPVEFEIY